MSSSPRRAEVAPSESPTKQRPAEGHPFPYGEVAAAAGQRLRAGSPSGSASGYASDPPAFAAEREAQARAAGRQQGELESRAKFEEQMVRERSAVAKALADFTRDRAAYYQKIEQETVQLSLAIARQILHREAQVDPQLLMGIVRVALERIEGATGVVLAVHPQQAEGWRRFLASQLNAAGVPEIVEDPALGIEQCELRTSLGTARLGVEVQLKEIEQGLMDLLAARPPEKP